MKKRIITTNRFKRDFKKVKARNNFDEKEFEQIIELLAEEKQIPIKYSNHLLNPKESGIWECHIKPDWVLIYTKTQDILILIRTGNHADLF